MVQRFFTPQITVHIARILNISSQIIRLPRIPFYLIKPFDISIEDQIFLNTEASKEDFSIAVRSIAKEFSIIIDVAI
ncbi:hypothetical protein HI914_07438 [Erysiphe necator]|nr:hypothetical protein HI914_07438 [Erysiphe necator]